MLAASRALVSELAPLRCRTPLCAPQSTENDITLEHSFYLTCFAVIGHAALTIVLFLRAGKADEVRIPGWGWPVSTLSLQIARLAVPQNPSLFPTARAGRL